MVAKHDRILAAIFEKPTRGDIAWRDVEALFRHLGATIREGKGSRVRVELDGAPAVFHRPHPRKEASKACIRKVCEFLQNAGVQPNV